MICDICNTNETDDMIHYIVTVKKDEYSETIGEILKAGTEVHAHLAVCEQCANEDK